MEGKYTNNKLSDVGYSRLVEGTREFFQGLPVPFDPTLSSLKLNGGSSLPPFVSNDLVMNYSQLNSWPMTSASNMAVEGMNHVGHKSLKPNFEPQSVNPNTVYPSAVPNGYRISSGIAYPHKEPQPHPSKQYPPQQLVNSFPGTYSTPRGISGPPGQMYGNNVLNNGKCSVKVNYSESLCYNESNTPRGGPAPLSNGSLSNSELNRNHLVASPRYQYSGPPKAPTPMQMGQGEDPKSDPRVQSYSPVVSSQQSGPKSGRRESPLDLSVKTVRQAPDSTADDNSLYARVDRRDVHPLASRSFNQTRFVAPMTTSHVQTSMSPRNHSVSSFAPQGHFKFSNGCSSADLFKPAGLSDCPSHTPNKVIRPSGKSSPFEARDRLRTADNAQLVKSILRNSLEQKNEMKFRSQQNPNCYHDNWQHVALRGELVKHTTLPATDPYSRKSPLPLSSSSSIAKITPIPVLSPIHSQVIDISNSIPSRTVATSSPRNQRVNSPRGLVPILPGSHSPLLPNNSSSNHIPPLTPQPARLRTPPVLVSQPTTAFPLISPQPVRAKATTPRRDPASDMVVNSHAAAPVQDTKQPLVIPTVRGVTERIKSLHSTPPPCKSEPPADGSSRIRTKGELKQMALPKTAEVPPSQNQIFKSNSRSGSPRSPRGAKSPRSVSPWGTLGAFSKKRDIFANNLSPPKLEKSVCSASQKPSPSKQLPKESDSSVFDFRESDSDPEMPVLEKQTFEPLRRRADSVKAILAEKIQQKPTADPPTQAEVLDSTKAPEDIPETSPFDFNDICDGLLRDLETSEVVEKECQDNRVSPSSTKKEVVAEVTKKKAEPVEQNTREDLDFLTLESSESEETESDFEKELKEKVRKTTKKTGKPSREVRERAAKKRIPMMKDESSSTSLSEGESSPGEEDRSTRRRPLRNRILYNDNDSASDDGSQKGSAVVKEPATRETNNEGRTLRTTRRKSTKVEEAVETDANKVPKTAGRPKKKKHLRTEGDTSNKRPREISNLGDETVTDRLRPRKDGDKSREEPKKKKKKKKRIDNPEVKECDIEEKEKKNVKAKPEFGDGSGFAPGWEDELIQYKKSVLRMPAQLLTVPKKVEMPSVRNTDDKTNRKSKVKGKRTGSKFPDENSNEDVGSCNDVTRPEVDPLKSISLLRELVKKYKKSASGVKAVPTLKSEQSPSVPSSDSLSGPAMSVSPSQSSKKRLPRAKLKEIASGDIPLASESVSDVKGEIEGCKPVSLVSDVGSSKPPQEGEDKCNPIVSAADQPGDNAYVIQSSVKKKVRYRVMRRKFRSGFDYLRKKKKKKKDTPSGVVTRKPPICPPLEGTYETTGVLKDLKEVQTEIKTWVVNKGLGETTLHRAARLGYYEAALQCLLTQKNAVLLKDNAGYTPLHEACSRGHLEMARLLLQFGADPNASAKGGIRPLHEVVESGRCEMARLLLSFGADPTLATYSGVLPITLAKHKNMKILLQGYLDDINGRPSPPWEFMGLASFMKPEPDGFDLFEDIPDVNDDSDTESPLLTAGSEAPQGSVIHDKDAIVFEISDHPIPHTYVVRGHQGMFCVLHEFSKSVSKSQDFVRKNCTESDVLEMTWSEFLKNCVCCQLLEGFRRNEVTRAKKGTEGKVVLVRMTPKLKALLKLDVTIWNQT